MRIKSNENRSIVTDIYDSIPSDKILIENLVDNLWHYCYEIESKESKESTFEQGNGPKHKKTMPRIMD